MRSLLRLPKPLPELLANPKRTAINVPHLVMPDGERLRWEVHHKGFTIGRAVHSPDEIDAAVVDGASDYLMFGTVFASAGKPPGHPVAGLDALRDACRRSPLPVIAIGGIDPSRLDDIAHAGAAGFAGVGMFG